MNDLDEVIRRLKDAKACLESARKNMELEDYRVVVQNAQLCIELSAKGIIAYFVEPLWRHDPSQQLEEITRTYKEEIQTKLGEDMIDSFEQLPFYAREVAPWHGWSTYGKENEEGILIPAVDLCTKGIAEDLLAKAELVYKTAYDFLQKLSC